MLRLSAAVAVMSFSFNLFAMEVPNAGTVEAEDFFCVLRLKGVSEKEAAALEVSRSNQAEFVSRALALQLSSNDGFASTWIHHVYVATGQFFSLESAAYENPEDVKGFLNSRAKASERLWDYIERNSFAGYLSPMARTMIHFYEVLQEFALGELDVIGESETISEMIEGRHENLLHFRRELVDLGGVIERLRPDSPDLFRLQQLWLEYVDAELSIYKGRE